MVKLTQVEDETSNAAAASLNQKEAEQWEQYDSESDSDIEDDLDVENETLYERLVALKDIVPPEQRIQISKTLTTMKAMASKGISFSGSWLWTITSTGLLLGFPWFIALFSEMQLQELEKGMSMQQSTQDVIANGAETEATKQ